MTPDEAFNDSRAKSLTAKLQHLMDNCLHNMGIKEMEEISEKMRMLLAQGMFWIEREDFDRFAYDLQSFINWLMEFIADKEREFWNE
tara:strand:- start:33 stop:293 length:261 start_codon:yes stop_codon:yes gene_type:complete